MSDHSAIEWTDATWNPVSGCTKVSPGCANCYIERTPPFRMEGRRFVNGSTGVRLHPERLEQPLRWRKPRRVFVCSLADLFHDDVPEEFIAEVFSVMYEAHWHTFQVLTKRPERARDILTAPGFVEGAQAASERRADDPDDIYVAANPWPPRNVWLGVSIENARHTWRADVLREIPAAVRFISAEPLLGSLFPLLDCDCRANDWVEGDNGAIRCGQCGGYTGEPGTSIARVAPVADRPPQNRNRAPLDLSGIDWVIVGGESGPGARPMHPDWAREIRDACLAACPGCGGDGYTVGHEDACYEDGACSCSGVQIQCACERPSFFFKQWGGKTPKANGRLLDGRTWDEMPRPTEVLA